MDTKKVLMLDRCYRGVQWPEPLESGQEYELPVEFADWLVAGSFAQAVKPAAKAKPQAGKLTKTG